MALISNAYATTSGGVHPAQMNFMSFLPMVVIFVLFWFLLIRPQQKKAKQHSQMIGELKSGDEIVTNSGILGKIVKIDEQFMTISVNNETSIAIQKNVVANKVEAGTVAKLTKK